MLTPISKATDFLCISGAAYISHGIVFHDSSRFSNIDGLLGLIGLTLPFITFRLTRVYQPFRYESVLGSVMRVLLAWLLAQLTLALLSRAYPGGELRGQWFFWWTGVAACALVAERCVIHYLPFVLRTWRFSPTHFAIVAPSGATGDLLARIASLTGKAFVPEAIFDPSLQCDTTINHIPAVRDIHTLKQLMRKKKLREIWIINPSFGPVFIENLFEDFRDEFINIRMLPLFEGSALMEPLIEDYRGVPILNFMAIPEKTFDFLLKNIFDLTFSLCVLLGIFPALLAIAIAVKISSPGPILFRQYRKGMNGEVFSIYKFRTMFHGADKPGIVVQARRGDTRVTRVGRFLRSTSLDELPQFLNVLKGEMSVVGPRPHAVEHDEYYKDLVQDYMFRYRIKPGVTGWAQVNGYRGETAEIEKMEARIKCDIFYIRHWTFWMDMKIIALTIINGFMGETAY
ncbi:undecaprenyl-phosphate glucose phosphotransferase [Paraburkholderia phymatum]|uniref:undecaprenyl-phosphate glucose phosphotransferase n=1 Tax=Paraburkholderia phymatum TaxID=148447 RepID=UPI0031735CEF